MFDAIPDASSHPDPLAGHEATQHAMPGHVARREKRVGTNLVGTIRLPDGTELPCVIRDISQSGAKLGVPGSRALPERFMFKMNQRDLIFQVRLAWRRQHYAGVRIERIAKLQPGQRPD